MSNKSFAALKKNRSNQLSSLHKEIEKINNPSTSRNEDDRFWRAELDKSGNGYAVIRFLPAAEGEDLPWVRVFNHGFQGPGGWYIENSLTTLGQKDPLSDYNSMLWNSGVEANKEIARIDLHLKHSGGERPSQSSERGSGSVVQVRKEDFRQGERSDESRV